MSAIESMDKIMEQNRQNYDELIELKAKFGDLSKDNELMDIYIDCLHNISSANYNLQKLSQTFIDKI